MMKKYIDAFLLPIAKSRLDEYQKVAELCETIWTEHGALDYWENLADDLHPEGVRSFSELAKNSEDETVVLAFATYESKEARDIANEKIMADPRLAAIFEQDDPVVDCSRLAHGGFRQIVGG